MSSGYVDCGCRDCFEIAIATFDPIGNEEESPALCHDCEKAGCEVNNGECKSPHAYGGEDEVQAKMKLQYIGRQGFCRYYWRIFPDGTKAMYAKVDGGILQPVAI